MNNRTLSIVYYGSAVLFALASGINVFCAIRWHQLGQPMGYYVTWAAAYLGFCLLAFAMGKRKSGQSK